MASFSTANLDYVEAQYARWKSDPASVPDDWRRFFEGFELGAAGLPDRLLSATTADRSCAQARLEALANRHRELGHLLACLDPLEACPTEHPLLELAAVGLSPEQLETPFLVPQGDPAAAEARAPLAEILAALRETYCRAIGVEFMHLQDPAERQWLMARMEPVRNRPGLAREERRRILDKLLEAAVFEQFLNRKYVGVTRFSLEGAEALLPALDFLCDRAAGHGCREVILGMAHRGRLNVQVNLLGKPPAEIFSEFENCYDPEQVVGAGDVKYHNGYLGDIRTFSGHALRILLMNNPSHLEAVDPVVEGFARARQETAAGGPSAVLPLLIHGDAAFAGQGIVAETLNLSRLSGYTTGGTLHLVVNNQIGYTTLPEHARSTRYATDIAKMLMVPIFHVHGEHPEAVVHAVRLAVDYRFAFGKDAVVDLVCYRRHGHNEGDEPYFTQPLMYARIRERPALDRIYAGELIAAGEAAAAAIDAAAAAIEHRLAKEYDAVHGSVCVFPEPRFYENWERYSGVYSPVAVDTRVPAERLAALAEALARLPEGFRANPKVAKLLERRRQAVASGAGIDWANAEALAFATLLAEGTPVRLSGQDSGRGTFSQRHSRLVDTATGAVHLPLAALGPQAAACAVIDSPLSEAGVLGFEYGYALARPEALVLWEAQFGDFVNNAQAVVDLFIAGGEAKWRRLNGLTLLLPHGLEGLGPEHSSARPERFLGLCAGENLIVCNPTTPAQYFHLLRRQVKAEYRKPLVVLTPKSLLRHPRAVSTLAELAEGGFRGVLDDPEAAATAKTILFCSGKIAYELIGRREELGRTEPAVIRLEQLYPFPQSPLRFVLKRFKKAERFLWVQEEPQNMGAWSFVRPLLEAVVGRTLGYIGRKPAATPATGFPHIFRREQEAVIAQAVGPRPAAPQG